MATPAQRQPSNLRLSFQKALKDRVQTPNTDPSGRAYAADWIDYGDVEFQNSGHDYWAAIEFIEPGAGNYAVTMLQISCFSRVNADRYGVEIDRMIDLFQAALRQNAGCIDIYDYSTQASPVIVTGKQIQIVNGDGRYGEPESLSKIEPPQDSKGMALTYLYRVVPDDLPSFPHRDAS